MTESRQQRRARERVERKAATRSGPNLRPVPDEPDPEPGSAFIEVDVRWNKDSIRPEGSYWSAEWGERDSDACVVEGAETFEALIGMILTDLPERWDGHELEIEWTLDRAAERELESSGIELPREMSNVD